ncbi:MAG: VCBS repeat-containing protein [Thermoplasmata archaeon]
MQLDSIPLPEIMRGLTPSVTWTSYPTPPAQNLSYTCAELADINLDGCLDIIAGYDGLGFHIWTGNGGGEWTPFAPPSGSYTFNDVKIADMNNDGKPDIVGATELGVYVWTGNGAGAWNDTSPALASRPFYSLALADIDLDGKMDIVAGSKGQGASKAIWVYLGRGGGVWDRGDTNLPTSGTYNGIAIGDFNRDGKPDIAGAGNGLKAWSGNGIGGWTERIQGLPGNNGAFSDVEFCDFNIDGNLDIVATTQNNGGLNVWNGDGWGIWTMNSNLPLNGNYKGVEVADINIDGYMDILTASSNSNDCVWTGDGLDNWYLQIDGLVPGIYHNKISSGDVNNDGRIDICMLTSTGSINVWTSHVEREVNLWSNFPTPSTTGTVNDILVFDVNRDGKMDICYAFESKGLEIWTGNGNGTWTSFPSPGTAGNYNSIKGVDFNKDGKIDIIATSGTGVKAWAGNGNGTWSLKGTLPSSNNWLGLTIADFNNDGNQDLVIGTGFNMGLMVYKGNGIDTWNPTYSLPFTGTYYDIYAADLNRDGAMDIIAANGGIKVFLGNANDGWTDSSSGLPGVSDNYHSVKVADINSDGIIDIIGASSTAGVNVWLGDGTGQWSFNSNIMASDGSKIALADFTIDGELDICISTSQGAGILGKGNGGMTWTNVSGGLPPTGNFSALKLADINIDGLLDIITFNNTAQVPQIWIGNYIAPPTPSFSIGPLVVGWNLVSTPLMPLNNSLPGALMDLDENTTWNAIKWYNGSSKAWMTHRIGSVQTLASLDITMGAWLYIPDMASLGDGYIRLEGEAPASTPILLEAGWNLVGYPSATPGLGSAILPAETDIISVFQPTSPYAQDITDLSLVTMSAGNGYWVHVTADCIWTVPP